MEIGDFEMPFAQLRLAELVGCRSDGLIVDHDPRAAATERQTFDTHQTEEPVGGGLAGVDAQALFNMGDELFGTLNMAAHRLADLDEVPAVRDLPVHGVELDHREGMRRGAIGDRRRPFDGRTRHPTVLALDQVENLEQHGALGRMTAQQLVDLGLVFGHAACHQSDGKAVGLDGGWVNSARAHGFNDPIRQR
jgi:hypothetical protein